MRVQAIAYVTDMERSIAWYNQLLATEPAMISDHWTPYALGDGTLALHWTDSALLAGNAGVSLVVDEPLEDVLARVSPGATIDEQPFGRSFGAIDPDGMLIQVNEHAE